MLEAEDDSEDLLRQAASGEQQCWETLLARHRPRLRRMIALRLDHRLQGRFDPSDVLQEAFLEAHTQLGHFLQTRNMPFFLWLRLIAAQRLQILHRHHLRAGCRDAGREISLGSSSLPEASSIALAERLLSREVRPSEAAIRAETKLRLERALNSMDPMDREVLALRHFEQLTNAETAQALGIQESAASKRYLRALQRLKEILTPRSGNPGEAP